MYSFSLNFPAHPGCHKTLTEFPVLYSRSLLVIHFKYSSVYMSIPNSLTVSFPQSYPGNHKRNTDFYYNCFPVPIKGYV